MSATADFLVEIGTEELPPKSLADAGAGLCQPVQDGLGSAGLRLPQLQSFATPRRLAVLVSGLQREQRRAESREARTAGQGRLRCRRAPTRAAVAFAEGCGVPVDGAGTAGNTEGRLAGVPGRRRRASRRRAAPRHRQRPWPRCRFPDACAGAAAMPSSFGRSTGSSCCSATASWMPRSSGYAGPEDARPSLPAAGRTKLDRRPTTPRYSPDRGNVIADFARPTGPGPATGRCGGDEPPVADAVVQRRLLDEVTGTGGMAGGHYRQLRSANSCACPRRC